jgi:hypothetical protein
VWRSTRLMNRMCRPHASACMAGLCTTLLVFFFALPKAQATEAPPPAVALVWDAPPACPTRAEFLGAVDHVAGAAKVRDPLDARARVESEGAIWRADITLLTRGEASSRHVEGSSCRDVTNALVLIVALALNRASVEPPEARLPDAADWDSAQPVQPILPFVPPVLAPPKESHLLASTVQEKPTVAHDRAFSLGIGLLVDGGSLPVVGVGGELGIALRIGRIRLEARTLVLDAKDVSTPERPSEGAHFLLIGANAGACIHILETPRWSFGPCARAGAEWIFADGYGSQQPRNATADIAVAELGLGAGARLSPRWGLRAAFDAVIPFTHPEFYIEQADTTAVVFHVPAWSARGSIGMETYF